MSDKRDIVERLRDSACCWRGDDPIAIELRQAADEIERLRKFLDEISKMKNDEPYSAQHAIDALEQQREAL
jgi:hypothetical protein